MIKIQFSVDKQEPLKFGLVFYVFKFDPKFQVLLAQTKTGIITDLAKFIGSTDKGIYLQDYQGPERVVCGETEAKTGPVSKVISRLY